MENATNEKEEEAKQPESLISAANNAADRLEKANKEMAALIEKQERILAEQRLGGRSEAGQLKEKPKELTPQEYAEKILKGEINPLK